MIIGDIKWPLNICVNKLDGILVKKETLPGPARLTTFGQVGSLQLYRGLNPAAAG